MPPSFSLASFSRSGQLGDVGGDAARPVSITSTSATVAACGPVAHEAIKIFMLANTVKARDGAVHGAHATRRHCRHILAENHDPEHWHNIELGKYIISDEPMTEERRAAERAALPGAADVQLGEV